MTTHPTPATVARKLTTRYKSYLQRCFQLEFEHYARRLTTLADLRDPEWTKRRDDYVNLWLPVVRQSAIAPTRARER